MLVKVLAILPILIYLCAPEPIGGSRLVSFDTVQKRQKKAERCACPMDPKTTSKKAGPCPTRGMTLGSMADEANSSGAPTLNAAGSATGDTASPVPSRIPDVRVYNQNGKALNFYSDIVKGNTIAIDFIFTTCTTICPQLTATFRRVQQSLTERALRVQLISISVDPTTDTPARLHDFAAKFKVGPGWTFVSGDKTEIDSLLQALGAGVGDKNNHTPRILVGNDVTGYWTSTSGLSSPSAIVKVIAEAASHK